MRTSRILLVITVLVLANLTGVLCAPTTGCQLMSAADVVFLLDSSGWSGFESTNFQKELDFVAQFVDSLDIGPNAVQVGVTTFANIPLNRFWLNQYQNKADLLAAIHAIPFAAGKTYTDKALQFSLDNDFTTKHGDRNNVPNILILMTYSYSLRLAQVKTVTNIIKGTTHWSVFAVGVGPAVSQSELNAIATDTGNVFTVSDVSALRNIQATVQNTVCGNVPKKVLCIHNGKNYTNGPTWHNKCENICQCMDTMATNCTQQCTRLGSVPTQCQLIQDLNNLCCRTLSCATPLFG